MSRVRAVLFDLDGTLIDSAPDLGAAANRLRLRRGLAELPLDDYRSMAGAGARGMLGVAFGMTPDHADYDAMREEFFVSYEGSMAEHTRIFDGVPELIRGLHEAGLAWGVVTNKAERFTLPLTRQIPLFESAGAIVSGDTTPHAKPHPAPLLEAARRLGLPAGACIYVGDDERDIVAGRAAGMPTVAAKYGYLGARAEIAHWHADASVDRPLDVLHVLAALKAEETA